MNKRTARREKIFPSTISKRIPTLGQVIVIDRSHRTQVPCLGMTWNFFKLLFRCPSNPTIFLPTNALPFLPEARKLHCKVLVGASSVEPFGCFGLAEVSLSSSRMVRKRSKGWLGEEPRGQRSRSLTSIRGDATRWATTPFPRSVRGRDPHRALDGDTSSANISTNKRMSPNGPRITGFGPAHFRST